MFYQVDPARTTSLNEEDLVRTTSLSEDTPPDVPQVGPLAPPADPHWPEVLPRLHLYTAMLMRPARGSRTSWIGGGLPPGWEWAHLDEYEVQAAHIRVAALKVAQENGLLRWLVAANTWLAVRWVGYSAPTLYVNHGWLAARIATLARIAAATEGADG